jgi:uracil-DNA glycosylase family 4
MGKKEQLQQVEEKVRHLTASPLFKYRKTKGYSPVIGEGNVDADIMMVGEAPGKREAETGRPFVGAAGQILDGLLESIGLDRDQVYITNVVKDRPPENRDPTSEEIELYAPFLICQIDIIQPRVIVTLGRFAMDYMLKHFGLPQRGRKIGDLHGQILDAESSFGHLSILPLYHPAAAFYNQDLKKAIREDIKVLRQFT